jgi:hypothetical protein
MERQREHLGARARLEWLDDDDTDVAKPALPGPGKLLLREIGNLPSATRWQGEPAKRTRVDAELDGSHIALESPSGMLPVELPVALRNARIDRRAEPGADAAMADGLLATALAFAEGTSGARSLPEALQDQLGKELGVDLSGVRIHCDQRAALAAAQIYARAFTIGDDIYFAADAYDADSQAGIELIAHEVAHVAQHRREGAGTSLAVSRPGDRHERQADEFAAQFARS